MSTLLKDSREVGVDANCDNQSKIVTIYQAKFCPCPPILNLAESEKEKCSSLLLPSEQNTRVNFCNNGQVNSWE